MRSDKSVTEVARNFAEYLNRVAFNRERFVLFRGKKAVAQLVPVPSGMRLGDLPALLDDLPALAHDDVAAFAEELDSARAELATEPVTDPWGS